MRTATSLKLNESALAKAKKGNYNIVKSTGNISKYNIGLYNDNRMFFEINLTADNPEINSYKFHTTSHLNRAKSVEEILSILRLQKSFYEHTITINGQKLFGDILVGDFKAIPNSNIDDTINYWNRIAQLEKIIKKKFHISLPLSDSEKELLEELCISFIDDMPVSIGKMNYLDIVPTHVDQLENIKKGYGDFAVVMKCDGLNLLGVNFSALYKVFFYGKIKVIDYKKLSNDEKPPKFRLIIDEDKSSIAAIKYFKTKKTAEEYLKNKSDEFYKAKKLWTSE